MENIDLNPKPSSPKHIADPKSPNPNKPKPCLIKITEITEDDRTRVLEKTKQKIPFQNTENNPKRRFSLPRWLKNCCFYWFTFICPSGQEFTQLSQKELITQIRKLRADLTKPALTAREDEEYRTSSRQKTLVLDLEGTLVYCNLHLESWDICLKSAVVNNKKNQTLYVKKRFGLDYFLTEISKFYQIIVFSSKLKEEADRIIDAIDPHKLIKHRLYQDSCTHLDGKYMKNLNILNRKLKDVVLLDYSVSSGMVQPENYLGIRGFNDNPRDKQLIKLIPFLKYIARVEDVRPVSQHYEDYSSQEIIIRQNKNYMSPPSECSSRDSKTTASSRRRSLRESSYKQRMAKSPIEKKDWEAQSTNRSMSRKMTQEELAVRTSESQGV